MGLQTDVDLLRARFETSWQALHPTVHYILDNDPEYTPAADEQFVVFSIKPTTVATGSMAYGLAKQEGTFTVKVCVPAESGAVAVWPLVDSVLSIFAHWRSSDNSLTVGDFTSRPVPASDTDPYYQFILIGNYNSLRAA